MSEEKDYQDTVYHRLASFLVRFMPKEVKYGYSDRFLRNQMENSMRQSRAVSPDGEINSTRVARAMARNHGVAMPDSLDDDSYIDVELGESE